MTAPRQCPAAAVGDEHRGPATRTGRMRWTSRKPPVPMSPTRSREVRPACPETRGSRTRTTWTAFPAGTTPGRGKARAGLGGTDYADTNPRPAPTVTAPPMGRTPAWCWRPPIAPKGKRQVHPHALLWMLYLQKYTQGSRTVWKSKNWDCYHSPTLTEDVSISKRQIWLFLPTKLNLRWFICHPVILIINYLVITIWDFRVTDNKLLFQFKEKDFEWEKYFSLPLGDLKPFYATFKIVWFLGN